MTLDLRAAALVAALATAPALTLAADPAPAAAAKKDPHAGLAEALKDGYQGPATCEKCHAGVAHAFLDTVHWKHASKVTNV